MPSPRRGRPPNAQLAAERRRALIAAASEVFAERGYTAAGIADIDARLAIGRGTFYRHFESKREILDHVVDDAIARLVAAVLVPAPDAHPPDAPSFFVRVDELVERVFAAVRAEPGILRLLLLETTSVDEDMTRRLLDAVDAVTAAVADALRHGVAAGYLRADLDPEVVAGQILYLLVPGLLRAVRGLMDEDDTARYRSGVVDLLEHGVRP